VAEKSGSSQSARSSNFTAAYTLKKRKAVARSGISIVLAPG